MVKCKFGLRQQVKPAIRGERDVSRRQDRNKVVLGCANGALRRKRAVVMGGNVLVGDGDRDEEN